MLRFSYTWATWGADWGHLQLRAHWNYGPRPCLFATERGIWFLFVGPFVVSGHTWR